MHSLDETFNILEIIESDLLKDKQVQKFQLICNNRLKACFIVDNKFVIGIEEHQVLNCRK